MPAPRPRLHRLLRLAALACLGAALPLLLFEGATHLSAFPTADLRRPSGSWRILDADGRLLREAVGADGARAQWRPLQRISPLVVGATVAVEDARYFRHRGVDWTAVLRAALDNARSGRIVSGASTLTMQLSRLVHPHPRTFAEKLSEMVEARRIERALDKWAILEQYLNRAPYGAGTVGVEAASQRFFGKTAARLSLAEAALIAGLPKAPTALNPLRHPAAARERQQHVLRRMYDAEMISEDQLRRALAAPLALRPRPDGLHAMHFTDLVLRRRPPAGQLRSTLDLELQLQLEALVREEVRALALAGATNAAVVVLDNTTCSVLAMVGSADYWAEPDGAVNGAVAPRQPGSALKPFTYALAFERGHTPATVVADVETRYGDLVPRNFSGEFSGPVLMGDALGRSLNVPAVRVASLVGAGALLAKLRQVGFTTLRGSAARYGLGLTLGNGEVTLLELAQGYAALARGGQACTARLLTNEPLPAARRVFSEETSFLVTHALTREGLRLEAFGPANALMLGFPVAVKTGTSSDWRDSWAAGYTASHTVAVWVGDFGGRSMNQLSGASGAGRLFHRAMQAIVAQQAAPPEPPRPPRGVVQVEVCALSGGQPTRHCTHRRAVFVPAKLTPLRPCAWHQEIAVDRRNGLRVGERCPVRHLERRVFEVLPQAYAQWQAERGGPAPPTGYSPLCPSDGAPAGGLAITSPRPGDVFLFEPGYATATQTLELKAQADAPVARVAWRVDGQRVAAAHWPYVTRWPLQRGRHTVQVDAPGLRGDSVTFEVR